jgi:16S rRNA processing protein RimM
LSSEAGSSKAGSSEAGSGGTGEFITLARVVKTQGRHGEVAVEVHTDVPDRFVPGMRLFALGKDGRRQELQLEGFWPHKALLVLELAGVNSLSDAEAFVGCELQVPSAERAELEPGWSYVSDLAGCTVFDGEREIGKLSDVRFGAGEAPLLVVTEGKQEYEIPFAQAFLKRVDLAAKRIEMALPEGLLEVNAPLTAEEKKANQ